MKWHEAEKQSLRKLRDLILDKHDDVFSESICETEELITWGWHANTSVLEEHGLMEVVGRLANGGESVWVGAGYFCAGDTQRINDECVQFLFAMPVDIESVELRRACHAP